MYVEEVLIYFSCDVIQKFSDKYDAADLISKLIETHYHVSK